MLTLVTRLGAGFGALMLAALATVTIVWLAGWALWLLALIDDPNTYLDALWTFTVDLGGWKRFAGVAGGSAVGAVLFDGFDATDLVAIGSGTRSDDHQGPSGDL